ncbi:MAG: hypothetical protein K0R82_1398 [Flavipsychrobacter sp.]|nr:hypothetical protein [Flavipsychrobacter sp.]
MLELFLYRGQYQLGTSDALYSDGSRYAPLVTAFNTIKSHLPRVGKVLVLGTGLGSAVQILNKQGFYPAFTLVENDLTVLNWALELFPETVKKDITPVCEDAKVYIGLEQQEYDLVIVDIFVDRVVPGFATTEEFLNKCRRRINPGGHLVFNYIVNSKRDWEHAWANIRAVFPSSHVIDRGINKIITAQV